MALREVDFLGRVPWRLSFRSSSPQGAVELLEVEDYDLRRFGRPAAKFSKSSKVKGQLKDKATPSRTVQNRWHTVVGHRMARAQETQNVFSSTMTRVKERQKETRDCPKKRQPTPKSEVSNRTGTRPSGTESRLSCFLYKNSSCFKDKHCGRWHLPFCVFHF